MFGREKDNKDDKDKDKAGKKDDKDDPNASVLEALKGLTTAITDGSKAQLQGMNQLRTDLALQADDKKVEDKDDPIIPEGTEIDEMKPSDILSAVEKIVGNAIGKIDKRFEEQSATKAQDTVRGQMKELSKDPLFGHLKTEMGQLLKEDPSRGNNVQDLFDLAQQRNAAKVATFKEEAKKDDKDDKDDKEEKDKPTSFGGLTPTSDVGDEKPEKMGDKEAALKAWEDTMGDISESVIGNA